MPMDYEKLTSNDVVGVFVGPTGGATGIAEVGEPTVAELNNTAGSGVLSVAEAISFNDWSFGQEASETTNEPSLADSSSFEEFGQSNFGGSYSPYYPESYDDASNTISNLYDLIDQPGSRQDHAVRIDGDIDSMAPAEEGQFVSVYRTQREGETNPFTPGESKRYVASFIPKSDFAFMVVVGSHEITAIEPATYAAGDVGRIRASQQGRDVTNYLDFSTDDASVIDVSKGGFFSIPAGATGSASVTIEDPETGDSEVVAVTIGA